MQGKDVFNKAKDILDNYNLPDRHSWFQVKYFIVNKEPTVQGKLWQIIREIRARMENLDVLSEQIEDTEDNINLLKLEAEKNKESMNKKGSDPDSIEYRIALINDKKYLRKIHHLDVGVSNLKIKIRYILEELGFFVNCFNGLIKEEGMKSFDDETVQREYWEAKLDNEVKLKLALKNPIDSELMKTIGCLDPEMKIFKNSQNLLEARKNTEK